MADFVVPLGVSAAVPSVGRHFASVALVRESYAVLFDCGEGTQFRLIDAGIKTSRIAVIAITHLHGDHYLGLPGLLSSMSMQSRNEPVYIVGPAPLAEILDSLPGIGRERRPFEVHIKELLPEFTAGVVLPSRKDARRQTGQPGFSLSAAALDHTALTFGYRFQADARPGKLDVSAALARGITSHDDYRKLKQGVSVTAPDGARVAPAAVVSAETPGASFAYVSDSRPCDGALLLASNVDLLYHEATFLERDAERAAATGHSTAAQAAGIARDAQAYRLVLGHFSARYPDATVLAEEARGVFEQVVAAEELERYYLDGSDLQPPGPAVT